MADVERTWGKEKNTWFKDVVSIGAVPHSGFLCCFSQPSGVGATADFCEKQESLNKLSFLFS